VHAQLRAFWATREGELGGNVRLVLYLTEVWFNDHTKKGRGISVPCYVVTVNFFCMFPRFVRQHGALFQWEKKYGLSHAQARLKYHLATKTFLSFQYEPTPSFCRSSSKMRGDITYFLVCAVLIFIQVRRHTIFIV